MLKEFAIDPQVISSSFDTCRYLISQFGVDKGRLISRFPKKWKRLAIEATTQLPDGLKKQRTIEYLNSLNSQWLTLVASGRTYQPSNGVWLDNAIAVHQERPFDGIICNRHDPQNGLLDVDKCDDDLAEFKSSTSLIVPRKSVNLLQCANPLLHNCKQLRLVDAYFDPTKQKCRDFLSAILFELPKIDQVECEYHILERDYGINQSPSTNELINNLQQLHGCIPARGQLKIIRWKTIEGGERFHARYLLTENAGLNYEGGLDTAENDNQTTDVNILNQEVHQERWNALSIDANVYELFHPVLIVDANGNVSEI